MKDFFYTHWVQFGVYLMVIFTPIMSTFLWLGVFILFDLITGILKTKKAGEPLNSKKMSQTATKTLMYFMLIIASHIIDTQFFIGVFLPIKIAQLASGFLAVTEFKSITENISEVLGVPIWQYIKDKIYRKDV
jgi:phage-related holin